MQAHLTEETIFEIKHWVEQGWKLPLGRFRMAHLTEEGMRGY